MKKLGQDGSHLVAVALIVVAVAVVGLAGWRVVSHKQNKNNEQQNTGSTQPSSEQAQQSSSSVQWLQTEKAWVASGTPPACPDPLNLPPPTPLSKVTAILYPGQYRGGEYKPHGGFRFDKNSTNKVDVTVPMDGVIVRGAHYEVEGEPQYTFDMIAPCGLMFRFGHLRVLSPAVQKIADKFPNNGQGDSRSTNVKPPIAVKAGDVVATSVGLINSKNVFFDFGVYNLNVENTASKIAAYRAKHPQPELEWHAVCWLDLLSAKDSALVNSLPPGDPTSGKTSDYCK